MLDPTKILLEAQMQNLREELKPLFLTLPIIAEVNFKYYRGLVEQGFTEAQALELTKVHGTSLNKTVRE